MYSIEIINAMNENRVKEGMTKRKDEISRNMENKELMFFMASELQRKGFYVTPKKRE